MAYSAELLDHFRNPRCTGELANASVVVECTNPVCGDVIKLWLRVNEGRVTAASFKAAGCVPAIACGSWLAERLNSGESAAALSVIEAGDIERGLGRLPAASRHAAELAIDALRKAAAVLARQAPRTRQDVSPP